MSLERILVVEYLLCQGYLPCELDNLPGEQAKVLLVEAYQFAHRKAHEIEFDISLVSYSTVGFSLN